VTAITFVALGTSLPDTFASKTAAIGDPIVDSSIGNATGSNSVNVFLGLGLPWTIAAIYREVTPLWKAKMNFFFVGLFMFCSQFSAHMRQYDLFFYRCRN